MKKIIVILFFIFQAMFGYGQTYYPFPTTMGIWTMEALDSWWNPTGILRVDYLFGDTVINAHAYKKLYVDDYIHGAIREDNKVVYFYSADSSQEYLLYDFSKHIGDTVFGPYDEWCNFTGVHVDPVVMDIDSSIQYADGNYHKKWTFSPYSEWIEGIGSPINLLAPRYAVSVSGGWRLNCFINENGVIYTHPGTCITSVGDMRSDMSSIRIYPNPTSDFLLIQKASLISENSSFRIRDVSGGIVLEGMGIPERIDLAVFSAGVYFITFEQGGYVEVRKFVVN